MSKVTLTKLFTMLCIFGQDSTNKLKITQMAYLLQVQVYINFNCKMRSPSKAYARAKNAFQQQFPTRDLPKYSQGQSIFDLIHSITSQAPFPIDHNHAIQHLKAASDIQEYKIQHSWLQLDKQNEFINLEQMCYEMHSTGLLGQKEMFLNLSQKASSQLGDRLNNLIDEVWWNAQKKSEQQLYFFD